MIILLTKTNLSTDFTFSFILKNEKKSPGLFNCSCVFKFHITGSQVLVAIILGKFM